MSDPTPETAGPVRVAPVLALAGAVAQELQLPESGVRAVLALVDQGATVPFIARYRKEATGGLDEVQIRDIQERATYLHELHERRETVLASIREQGKLTPALERAILAATTKSVLEDLYAPYRKKRRTRAMIARERGLEPLALQILAQPAQGTPEAAAAAFADHPEVGDSASALAGARDIVAELVCDRAEVRAMVRRSFAEQGEVVSRIAEEFANQPNKFQDYADFREPLHKIPSHRFLAIRRGEREGILRVQVEVDAQALLGNTLQLVEANPRSPFFNQLQAAVEDGFHRLLAPSMETEVRTEAKQWADRQAVDVFAANLRNLLLAAPLGERNVVGIDPGLRTGCKCVAVDATGQYLDTVTIYPHTGQADRSAMDLVRFVQKFAPHAIAVGNGTGGRETESFVRQTLRTAGLTETLVVLVNEAGASVYSASDVAREEFPDLDLTLRGAISIARRLQDPLSELVKIDPKSIGVGQYQHDVHQPLLQKKLDDVVESCVNHVGVELNTASAPLLGRVAGLGPTIARRIVDHRNQHGPFVSRKKLLDVAGLGPRTFEQCAGFLRVRNSKNPLDASAVHPERYALVERMANDVGVPVAMLIGNHTALAKIELSRYLSPDVGEPTLRDILDELRKPGRDPRDAFEPPRFREDVHTMQDLKVGMVLEGVVTNVTAFGAFVDIGVHQDGLVHISRLSDRFIRDASEVVGAGDKLQVRVLEVDLPRKRISLTARLGDPLEESGGQRASTFSAHDSGTRPGRDQAGPRSGQRPTQAPPKAPVQDNALRHNPFAALQQKGRR